MAALMTASLNVFLSLLVSELRGATAWSPKAQTYDVPLKTPGKDGKTTQVSLYPANGPVHILDGSDITQLNASAPGQPVVVAMYASWCPHCWHLVPKWINVARAYSGVQGVDIAAINCADKVNVDACSAAGVEGFPTVQCYRCPQTPTCKKNGCDVQIFPEVPQDGSREEIKQAMKATIPTMVSQFIAKATSGSAQPSHPDLLHVVEPGKNEVIISGPPGRAGFVPNFFTRAEMRSKDAMRAFLSVLWSKNDANVALTAISFLIKLFAPPCCRTGGTPPSLTAWSGVELMKLKVSLSGQVFHMRKRLEEWASLHDITDLGNQENLATYKDGELSNGGKDGYKTCTTFTCAIWAFLHMLTTSSAYFAAAGSPRLSSGEVMAFTRWFVSEFLACDRCRHHFLASYDDCEFGRCKVETTNDWSGLVLWLWRVHEGVNLRTAARDNAPVDRRWPSYEDCPGCWRPDVFSKGAVVNDFDIQLIGKKVDEIDGPFNIENVYHFVVASYVGWRSLDVTLKSVSTQAAAKFTATALHVPVAESQSSNWLWWSFSAVAVAGISASLSIWRAQKAASRPEPLTQYESDMETAPLAPDETGVQCLDDRERLLGN